MSTVMKTTRDVKGIGLSILRPDAPEKVTGVALESLKLMRLSMEASYHA